MASFRSRCAAARCATAIFISYTSSLAAAQAAEQNESGAKPQASEEVVVTGHYDNAVGTSDAASAGEITRQLVEERPILRPGEVLEGASGPAPRRGRKRPLPRAGPALSSSSFGFSRGSA